MDMIPQVANILLPSIRKPWTGVGKQIESCVRKALYDFEMVPKDGKIAVALSGGKDSLTLLCMLKAISGKGFKELDLRAIHVGGEFSCGAGVNQKFLNTVCTELGIPLTVLESKQKLETLECYGCSRERRGLIFSEAKRWGCRTVAFGHTQDDQAQTVLMNLAQKGCFEGFAPKLEMVKYEVEIVRPLIYVSEEKIKSFAKQQHFLRICCQCPVGQQSMRKKFERIIENLSELVPEVRANLSRAALRGNTTLKDR